MVQLNHEVLQSVLKPSRYTGGEWNAVVKDWDKVDCTFALALPDVYEVGMSNLGLAILYEILNRETDIAAERVYAPWTDMEAEMRARNIPLFSLETKHELSQFDFFGFSLQYEMIYSNVLNMLDLSGIPLWSKDRGEDMPFIVGGGPCTYNPEPIADFFDIFYIGEGETRYRELFDLYKDAKKKGISRTDFLHEAGLFRLFFGLFCIGVCSFGGILRGFRRFRCCFVICRICCICCIRCLFCRFFGRGFGDILVYAGAACPQVLEHAVEVAEAGEIVVRIRVRIGMVILIHDSLFS